MRSRSTLSIARSKGLKESEGNDLALNPPPRRGGGRLWWVGVHFTPDDGAGLLAMCAQKKRPRMGRFSKPRQDSDYTEASSISCFAAFRSFIFLNHLSMMIMNGQEM